MKQLLNSLYIQTQGAYLHLERDTLRVEVERELRLQMPLHHLGSIVAFGNVLFSPFLLHRCGVDGRSVVWMTEYGRFKGRLAGPTSGNVLLRRTQYAALDTSDRTLDIARCLVAVKLQNARHVLMRAAREIQAEGDRSALKHAAEIHARGIRQVENVAALNDLRGVEGFAAKAYFQAFSSMVKTNRDVFALQERSRRPPRDPINALLSFAYTLLANDYVSACEGVGLDPQVGYLHALKPGRPALALDLMEELRAPFADRLVLTLVNRQQIQPNDFVERTGGAVMLTDSARKTFLAAYQKRKQDEVAHGVLEKKVPLGLVPHLQARLLARHLRGDLPSYLPFIQR
ncbi:MAG: type I-C CRISPR-associated endonuclease Cas1c [Cyanobacteria bacterium P01_E01_bin.48]